MCLRVTDKYVRFLPVRVLFISQFFLNIRPNMKLIISALLISSAAAFGSFGGNKAAPAAVAPSGAVVSLDVNDLAGILDPVGFFDPLGFAEKADAQTLKRYREAELTHGRVSMLAVIGFLVGEKVEGSSFLFDSQISGPAISHFAQVPAPFWVALISTIGAIEQVRANKGFVPPSETPVDQAGLLRADYTPGDMSFDPLGLKPEDPAEFLEMQTKELQHGRLAMLAAAGFLAQEACDGKGILEHLSASA